MNAKNRCAWILTKMYTTLLNAVRFKRETNGSPANMMASSGQIVVVALIHIWLHQVHHALHRSAMIALAKAIGKRNALKTLTKTQSSTALMRIRRKTLIAKFAWI